MAAQERTTVGIDIGTSSVKAVVVNSEGTVLARSRVEHAMITPTADRLEHDANLAWRDGPVRALAELGELGATAEAVGISAMVPSMTAVDAEGRALLPGLLYGDSRGWTEGRDGSNPMESAEAQTFLAWCGSQAPEAAGFWPAPAVAAKALGAPPVIDSSTAITTWPLFNGTTWDSDLVARAGVRMDQLPQVAAMGAAAGHTRGGQVLVPGCVDALAEQIVCTAREPGDVLVMLGTTLMTWCVVDEWLEAAPLWSIPWHLPNTYVVGGPSDAGGLFQSWVRRLVAADDSVPHPDRVPVWLPYLRGERVPLHRRDLRAQLHDADLTQGPAAITRAGYEASGFVVADILDRAGLKPTKLIASGGGVRVLPWVQAVADATGLPVHASAVSEGAALGMAWLGRMALGLESSAADAVRWAGEPRVIEPHPDWVGPCAIRRERFQELQGGLART